MAKERPGRREIDWGTAAVRDGELTVELTGEPSPDWNKRLEAVIGRLHREGRGWQAVEVRKGGLRAAAVEQGAESDLRHFLESVVAQTNADFAPSDEAEAEERDNGGRSPRDTQMTDTFRGFARDRQEAETK